MCSCAVTLLWFLILRIHLNTNEATLHCITALGDGQKLSIYFIIDSFGKSIDSFDGIIDNFYIFRDVLIYKYWKGGRIALPSLINVSRSEIWELRVKLNSYVFFGFSQICQTLLELKKKLLSRTPEITPQFFLDFFF